MNARSEVFAERSVLPVESVRVHSCGGSTPLPEPLGHKPSLQSGLRGERAPGDAAALQERNPHAWPGNQRSSSLHRGGLTVSQLPVPAAHKRRTEEGHRPTRARLSQVLYAPPPGGCDRGRGHRRPAGHGRRGGAQATGRSSEPPTPLRIHFALSHPSAHPGPPNTG